MSASRRVLRLACQLAVVLWIGGYLAWGALEAPVEVSEAPAARIEPRPEPPLAAPPAAGSEAPARLATEIEAGDLSRGTELLADTGGFPVLSSSYEDFRTFHDYARAMIELGARFVVVSQRKIVGAVDLESGALSDPAIDARFSPRARDYRDEPGLESAARTARARFGGDAAVMMLVPAALDAALFGGISRVLSERGDDHAAFRELRGRYVRGEDGGVRLHLDAGIRSDGVRIAMDLLFDLDQIANLSKTRGPSA